MDERKHLLCIFVGLFLFGQSLPVPITKLQVCDESRTEYIMHEGNIGESGNFPWLGLLRVHLHEFDQLKIAVTGLILVKDRYAIANAKDLSRIPKFVFLKDSKVMFIPKNGEPWFTKPKDYMIHPEYEFTTYNTIALIELDLEERTEAPFKPVCWPGNFFNTSNQLYALGYTDENKLMEKTLYSLQYVKSSLCKEFYNRAGFSEPLSDPTYVQCGFAQANTKDCLWENGMAMVSNSSGKWTLIGFGVRGPGCSAPARFIDMIEYFPWVESATDLEQVDEIPDFSRRSAFNVGFRRTKTPRTTTEHYRFLQEPYPGIGTSGLGKLKVYKLDHDQVAWYEMPLHLEEAAFVSGDRCSAPKILVYRERMKLVDSHDNSGTLEYRMTLYNRFIHNYTCMKLKIRNAMSRKPVYVWFRHDAMDLVEGTNFKGEGGETPSEILKYFPLPPKYEPPEEESLDPPVWKPGKHLKPQFITDNVNHTGPELMNIIVGFTFVGKATMELSAYGYPTPLFRRPTTTAAPTTTNEYDSDFFDMPGPPPHLGRESLYAFPLNKQSNGPWTARKRAAKRKRHHP